MKEKKKLGFNSRGLLFTIMTLFLIFGIITLNESLNDAVRSYSPTKETISLYSAANSYENASSLMYNLDKQGYALYSIGNIFPITPVLDRDANTFSLSQKFSIDQNQINSVFDYLNSTRVLLNDTNYSNAFSGTVLLVNSPKNSSWDAESLNNSPAFLLLPFCYQYTIVDTNTSMFSQKPVTPPCSEALSISKIKQVDINIVLLSSTIDFNSITCSPIACAPYLGAPTYYNLAFDKTNCPSCMNGITGTSIPIIGANSKIEIKGTNTPALTINISGVDINYSYFSEKKISISTKFFLNSGPLGFVVKDVNISAISPNNSASKKSN